MYYPVSGMVHIKEPLLLIRKGSPCGGSEFSLSLSELSFTFWRTHYNRKSNVLRASLNKTFPAFLHFVIKFTRDNVIIPSTQKKKFIKIS